MQIIGLFSLQTFSPDLIDGLIELITYSLTQCGRSIVRMLPL